MTPQAVRAGFQSVVPFLSIRGATRLAEFLSAAFNGQETYRSKTHFEVRIGDSMVMLGEAGDRPPTTGQLFMYVDDADALYQRAIQAGGTSLMEPCARPWGRARRCCVRLA